MKTIVSSVFCCAVLLSACEKDDGNGVDAGTSTACVKTCDDNKLICTAKCSDNGCRATCNTEHDDCTKHCVTVAVTEHDAGH